MVEQTRAPEASGAPGRLGPRGGSGTRRENDGPVLFEGQIVGNAGGAGDTPAVARDTPAVARDTPAVGGRIDVDELGLPTSESAIVSYLTNSYGGVGTKTAEALFEAFGSGIFDVFNNAPEKVAEIVPRRAPQVLAEWKADLARRSERSGTTERPAPVSDSGAEPTAEQGSVTVSPTEVSQGAPTTDSPPASPPAPRSGGARRRTRRGPRRPPSSGSDE